MRHLWEKADDYRLTKDKPSPLDWAETERDKYAVMPFDQLYKGAIFFWPPMSTEPVVMRNWQKKITLGFYGAIMAWILLVAWILGLFPAWVPRPAMATDLSNLQQNYNELKRSQDTLQETIGNNDRALRLGQLLPALDLARLSHCRAVRAAQRGAASEEVVAVYLMKLRELEMQYWQLMQQAWPREDCAAILIPDGG